MKGLCAYQEVNSDGTGLCPCGLPAVAYSNSKALCVEHTKFAASMGMTILSDHPTADFSARIAPGDLEAWLKRRASKCE